MASADVFEDLLGGATLTTFHRRQALPDARHRLGPIASLDKAKASHDRDACGLHIRPGVSHRGFQVLDLATQGPQAEAAPCWNSRAFKKSRFIRAM